MVVVVSVSEDATTSIPGKSRGKYLNIENNAERIIGMLNEKKYEIERWLYKLDQVAVGYEAVWGIGALQEHAPPDIKLKWDKQQEKLNAAIEKEDVNLLAHLVEGTIRAWRVLESEALKKGLKPNDESFLEVVSDGGQVYRIYKTTITIIQSSHKVVFGVLTGREGT